MLKWETYNLVVDWKETILEPSKLRFKRSRSDLSVKIWSNHELKIAVLNRSGRRFRTWNDVFSAKVKELSAMMYCNHGPKRDFLNGNCKNLACRESCFRRSNHRDERNDMLKWETYNLVFSAKVNELSAMMYCNHGPKRDFLNGNCRT